MGEHGTIRGYRTRGNGAKFRYEKFMRVCQGVPGCGGYPGRKTECFTPYAKKKGGEPVSDNEQEGPAAEEPTEEPEAGAGESEAPSGEEPSGEAPSGEVTEPEAESAAAEGTDTDSEE
jgi:hypothetical protein